MDDSSSCIELPLINFGFDSSDLLSLSLSLLDFSSSFSGSDGGCSISYLAVHLEGREPPSLPPPRPLPLGLCLTLGR